MGTNAIQTIARRNNSLRTTNAFFEKTKYSNSTFTNMRTTSSSVKMMDHEIMFRCPMNDTATFSTPINNTTTMDLPHKNKDPIMEKSLHQESQSLFLENASQGRQSQDCGNYDDALAYFRCALLCKRSSIASETLEMQVEYANILFDVGLIYMDHKHNFSYSSEALQQCLDIRLVCLRPSHIDVSATMYCLAKSLMRQECDQEYALELLNESLSILLISYPSNFNGLIKVWNELAQAQYSMGSIDDAESSLKEARNLTIQTGPFM
jgi:tetratricopeptide (TPR) repeat protein